MGRAAPNWWHCPSNQTAKGPPFGGPFGEPVDKVDRLSRTCKHVLEGLQPAASHFVGAKSALLRFRLAAKTPLRSLAPPLPNKPASLGFVWVPIDSHACGLSSVFSDAHVAGKNRFHFLPSSADDGTLRGSCTRSDAFALFRQAGASSPCAAGRFLCDDI